MSTKDPRDVVAQFDRAGQEGDVEALDAVCHPHTLTHSFGPSMPQGIEGVRKFVAMRTSIGVAAVGHTSHCRRRRVRDPVRRPCSGLAGRAVPRLRRACGDDHPRQRLHVPCPGRADHRPLGDPGQPRDDGAARRRTSAMPPSRSLHLRTATHDDGPELLRLWALLSKRRTPRWRASGSTSGQVLSRQPHHA